MVSVLCLVVWIQSIQSTTTPTGNNTTQISAMEEHQVVKDVIDTVPPHVAEVCSFWIFRSLLMKFYFPNRSNMTLELK